MSDVPGQVKPAIDVAVAATVGGSFLQLLPSGLALLGSLLGVLWFSIQIWESRTLQVAIAAWRLRRRASKLRRLKAKEKIILAQIAAVDIVRTAKSDAIELVEHAKAVAKADAIDVSDLGEQ